MYENSRNTISIPITGMKRGSETDQKINEPQTEFIKINFIDVYKNDITLVTPYLTSQLKTHIYNL